MSAVLPLIHYAVEKSPDRLHGLDAVRAIALLLGVVLHTTMSFLPGPKIWVVADVDRSSVLAIMFYVIHMFRMVLFFLIAGFFAHMLYHRLGQAAFIRDRLKRIAMPLFVGWPILFPMIVAVFVWSAYIAGGGTLPKNPPPGPTFMPNDFPLAHLWFLWVLMLLYSITLIVRNAVNALDKNNRVRPLLDHVVKVVMTMYSPILLAIPLAASLYFLDNWYMWFGIPTPDQTLFANGPSWIAFGSAFTFGWLLNRQRDLLAIWSQRWLWNLSLALVATIACLAIFQLVPVYKPADQDGIKLAYAMCYSIGVWSWSFAILGIGLRFMSGFSPTRRYIADASYWVYLIHLPIVMALQVWMAKWSLSWVVKFPLVLMIGLGLIFSSYHLLVRYTAIGAALNGTRRKRGAESGYGPAYPSGTPA